MDKCSDGEESENIEDVVAFVVEELISKLEECNESPKELGSCSTGLQEPNTVGDSDNCCNFEVKCVARNEEIDIQDIYLAKEIRRPKKNTKGKEVYTVQDVFSQVFETNPARSITVSQFEAKKELKSTKVPTSVPDRATKVRPSTSIPRDYLATISHSIKQQTGIADPQALTNQVIQLQQEKRRKDMKLLHLTQTISQLVTKYDVLMSRFKALQEQVDTTKKDQENQQEIISQLKIKQTEWKTKAMVYRQANLTLQQEKDRLSKSYDDQKNELERSKLKVDNERQKILTLRQHLVNIEAKHIMDKKNIEKDYIQKIHKLEYTIQESTKRWKAKKNIYQQNLDNTKNREQVKLLSIIDQLSQERKRNYAVNKECKKLRSYQKDKSMEETDRKIKQQIPSICNCEKLKAQVNKLQERLGEVRLLHLHELSAQATTFQQILSSHGIPATQFSETNTIEPSVSCH